MVTSTVIIEYSELFKSVIVSIDSNLWNVRLGELNQIADNYINSNLEKGKENNFNKTNALNIALIHAVTIKVQLKHTHKMIIYKDPVYQLTDKELKDITFPMAMKKVKAITKEKLGKALNLYQ